jgi:hypothetical protein
MDLIALVIAILGIALVDQGHAIFGIALLVVSLSLFAILLGTLKKPPLLLPFSFPSWFVVLPLAFLAALALRSNALRAIPLSLAFYYYGCIALVDRKARYAPWGNWFVWRTATRSERPMIYWVIVMSVFVLSGIFLAAGLLSVVRRSLPVV